MILTCSSNCFSFANCCCSCILWSSSTLTRDSWRVLCWRNSLISFMTSFSRSCPAGDSSRLVVRDFNRLSSSRRVLKWTFSSFKEIRTANLLTTVDKLCSNRLFIACNKLDNIIGLVTRLFQQVWHRRRKHYIITVSDLLKQPCNNFWQERILTVPFPNLSTT